ncbi:hypothetical protein H310_06488 [Aphanomyces invadans]|uniref:Uncharacterized protein n=1 Tax=Aphanomyces invadans TaxID=157072 RepID=A0A024U6S5_9STRA|nr:hypothetical protein H310_06488 [Aphanomyces invadans]ETW01959.1 hypothetical protein H310_06488 [Aphanomyces invadans]|eukprot:XP_008869807.1 hypothetical protein H310_06488 [Aphanomyces invadans]
MIRAIASDPSIQRERLLRVYQCLRECRATIDIADAVVVHHGELAHWYFTSTDGEVREKQPYALSLLELKKVFVKQGLHQTCNVARTLAVLFHEEMAPHEDDLPTVTFSLLQDVQFNTHACNSNSRLWLSTYLVTPFICGKFGPNHATYTGKYCRNTCGQKARVKFFKPTSYFFGTTEVSSSDGVTQLAMLPVDATWAKELGSAYDDALKHDILKLVQCIEAGTKHHVLQLYADFVLTATCRLILVRVASIVFEEDRRDAPVPMAPPAPRQVMLRPQSAHPSTQPHRHGTEASLLCPGRFCMMSVATRRHVHTTQNVISQKSIHVAEQESAFLAFVAAHQDANGQLAHELCHAVDMASYRNTIPNLREVDSMLVTRNRLLKAHHWFDQQAQDVAASTKHLATFYDMVHVCALCYIMYQRLDEARRACIPKASHQSVQSTASSSIVTAKAARPASAASSRLHQLAQPKKKLGRRRGPNSAQATTTANLSSNDLSTSPPPQAPASTLAKCLRGPMAIASRDAPVLSKSLARSLSLTDLKPIVPRRKQV